MMAKRKTIEDKKNSEFQEWFRGTPKTNEKDLAWKRSVEREDREIQLAWKRINGSPARRLRWLLEFAYLNLDSLSVGRFADLRWEVLAFGLNMKPDQIQEFSRSHRGWEFRSDVAAFARPLIKNVDEPNIREQAAEGAHPELVRKFQTTMRDAFDKLFEPNWWEVIRPAGLERIALVMPYDKDIDPEPYPPSLGTHDRLLIHAIDLIKAERQRIRFCGNPRCEKRFVVLKKDRAFFHSPKCSAYVRVNRARGKM